MGEERAGIPRAWVSRRADGCFRGEVSKNEALEVSLTAFHERRFLASSLCGSSCWRDTRQTTLCVVRIELHDTDHPLLPGQNDMPRLPATASAESANGCRFP